ncbi:S8 family serine peptidase [Salirhabdus salicampi]|uniref:S8 family serine peptidase n=1 Tax=Salirhabdus salicampi TaxID=476102 RepID=UPI0020C51A4B|nr:S8 family serine peptidase [Salirhabdus salicampi]MCP8618137.1 S8 family serine peptidase [Salirhabdus salicampi]
MKKLFSSILIAVLLLSLVSPFQSTSSGETNLEVDKQLTEILSTVSDSSIVEAVVSYDHDPTTEDLNLLKSLGLDIKTFSQLPIVGVKGTSAQVQKLLDSDVNALSVYANKKLDYFMRDSRELIGAERVWSDLGYTGKGTTVAVIDSGIDATHPDLPYGTKVIQNVKLLVGESIFGDEDTYLEGVLNTDTSSGHGTHVAGTIAGNGTASDGLYKGIAPDAQLVGIGAGEGLHILWALEGFNYVLEKHEEYGIDVISNSWGTSGEYSPNNPINIASKEAHDEGMVVVFAAGNAGPDDNTLNPYSAAPWVISVAAGTKDKELANFSSRGVAGDEFLHPDITAPGVDIVSTKSSTGVVMNSLGTVKDSTYIAPEHLPYYTTASGTSMATPHISGVVALMREATPDMHPAIVLDVLQKTADEMASYEFHEVGAGYVNAYEAVKKAEKTKAFIGKYKEKETGKTYDTYFEEYTWEGTVGPGSSTLEVESHDYYDIEIGKDSVSLKVSISWLSATNDLDLFVRDANGELVGSSANGFTTTEETTVPDVAEGTYEVDVEGWLNTIENYEGTYVVEKILK